jgi:hypothetical protein
MNESNFTYEEIGAFLVAIGTVMSNQALCANAANDGNSDKQIEQLLKAQGVDEDRVSIVSAMPLDFAINYIAPIVRIDTK